MPYRFLNLALLGALLLLMGCGTSKQHTVTEQLLSSDAVDRAVSQIDFTVLTGRKVYVDASYVQPVKNIGFVNDRYILSSLRQQMAAAGCLLQDSANEADVIVEPRVGALGTELHELVYGIPANNLLSNVTSLAPDAPTLPSIPELAVAKKNNHLGAAKVAVFAYERESREPIWQSGIAQSESRARDMWVLGAGPFQSGVIYNRTQFAGSEIEVPLVFRAPKEETTDGEIGFEQPYVFLSPTLDDESEEPVILVGGIAEESASGDIKSLLHEKPIAEPVKGSPPETVKAAPKEPAHEPAEPAKLTENADTPKKVEPPAKAPELENDDNASTLPAQLQLEADLYWHYMQQSRDPWYNPSPQVSSAQ